MDIMKLYETWLAKATEDADLIAELNGIKGDEREINERFYTSLKFGTAGLRGVIGAGTNRMNIYVVRQATQGLANYVLMKYGKGSVAISHDSRIKADLFMNEAAKVPVGLSGPAALYDYIYGDQFTDEKEYMEKVYPTRRELEYTYVQKAGVFYDLKMIVYTVICICYALVGKECTWILDELKADAARSIDS